MKKQRFLIGISTLVILLLRGGNGGDLYAALPTDCMSCHVAHGMSWQIIGPSLIPAANTENLCMSCHSAAGPGLEAKVHTNKTGSSYPAFRFSCRDCHAPHRGQLLNYAGNYNLKSVRASVPRLPSIAAKFPSAPDPLPVRFESRGTGVGQPAAFSFADNSGSGPWDGICEVCHALTSKHPYNVSKPSHQDGKTCSLSCHLHRGSFLR